jgi:large subunit ribosomal protein L14e
LGLKKWVLRLDQVLVDGATENNTVIRHSAPLSHLVLTPIVIANLPRAIGHGPLSKAWSKAEVDKQWTESSWAKNKAKLSKRQQLSDFERFKIMKLRKQVSA